MHEGDLRHCVNSIHDNSDHIACFAMSMLWMNWKAPPWHWSMLTFLHLQHLAGAFIQSEVQKILFSNSCKIWNDFFLYISFIVIHFFKNVISPMVMWRLFKAVSAFSVASMECMYVVKWKSVLPRPKLYMNQTCSEDDHWKAFIPPTNPLHSSIPTPPFLLDSIPDVWSLVTALIPLFHLCLRVTCWNPAFFFQSLREQDGGATWANTKREGNTGDS